VGIEVPDDGHTAVTMGAEDRVGVVEPAVEQCLESGIVHVMQEDRPEACEVRHYRRYACPA
jgi:hypothetical protein